MNYLLVKNQHSLSGNMGPPQGTKAIHQVELKIFYLPAGCSSSDLGSINTVQDLINKPMISCNVIAWSFLGLSMTNWNTILSLAETSIFLYLAYFIKDLHHEKIKQL